jgi:hypothetical protein
VKKADKNVNPRTHQDDKNMAISAVVLNGNPVLSTTGGGLRINASDEGTGKPEADGKVVIDPSAMRNNSKPSAEVSSDSEPPHVQQLRKMIEKLQKQLEQQQKQLQQVINSKMEETEKLAAIAAAQAAVSSTMAALASATAALVSALTENGGGGSGSLVSTSA